MDAIANTIHETTQEMTMQIRGIENLSREDLVREISNGAKFAVFQYCFSLVVLSFRRSTDAYFVPAGKSPTATGIPWTILSLLVGWWGIPWGLIFTPMVVYRNLSGGQDVTNYVMTNVLRLIPAPPVR